MSANSKIEWTDHTFNPWQGCTKVSPGCKNCYAEARDKRWHGGAHWGQGAPRKVASEAMWREPLKWNKKAKDFPYHCANCGDLFADAENLARPWRCPVCDDWPLEYHRPKVFCASLSDWLDEEVPTEWRMHLLETIHATPNLDWQLLTKRPENWQKLLTEAFQFAMDHGDGDNRRQMAATDWLGGWVHAHMPPANVWIGTTVEDQARAEERIPQLLAIPARVRFLSCEPLLERVGLIEWFGNPLQRAVAHHHRTGHACGGAGFGWYCEECDAHSEDDESPEIDWLICGGESGPGARPMHPDWARGLRDQCAAAGVPFFFKQWGEWAPFTPTAGGDLGGMMRAGKVVSVWPKKSEEIRMPGCVYMQRAGKHAAGRLLDGLEHSAFPGDEKP